MEQLIALSRRAGILKGPGTVSNLIELQTGAPRVAIFGPSPTLTVTVERRADVGGRASTFIPGARASGWRGWSPPWSGADPLRPRRRGGRTAASEVARGLPGELRLVETAGGTDLLRHRPALGRAPPGRLGPRQGALASRDRRAVLVRLRDRPGERRAGCLQPVPGRDPAAAHLQRPGLGRARERNPGARRPVEPSPRQRARRATRPGEAERLGAGRVRQGPSGRPGPDCAPRPSACSIAARRGAGHARREAGARPPRRRGAGRSSRPASSTARARVAATR